MPALATNVEAVWLAKQTAKGTPATTAIKKGRKVTGNFGVDVNYGSENYSDGARFNSASDFVDNITGSGSAGLQGQSGVLAYTSYLMLGAETVTGTGPYVHTITPGATSFWTTVWKSLGSGSPVVRQRFNDCRITSLVIEGSSGQKVIRVTPTVMSLDPAEIVATDPVKADDGTEPLLYTEAEGTFTLGGTVIPGHSAFQMTITDELNPYYGDSVVPMELVTGRGAINFNCTILADVAGLGELYKTYYGTATPSTGAKPAHTVPALGSYTFNATRGSTEQFQVTFAGLRLAPPDFPAGTPAGGAAELQFTGGGRISGSSPMVSIVVKNADPAYT